MKTGESSKTIENQDRGFAALVALVVVVAIWLVLTPMVPAVATASMHRFHLRSRSFLTWAIQFPIPTMYNFANRYSVRQIPPGLLDPIAGDPPRRYINHFPTRVVTFFNTRYLYLQDGNDCWFTIESSYRGQRLKTNMHLDPQGDGLGYRLHRRDGEDRTP